MIKKRLIAENRIIKDNFKAEQEKVKALLEERDSLREEISRLKEELCKDNGYKNSLCQGIYEFLAALPIIRALSGIIFTISERSILELTEDTFSLSQSSKDVGDNIKTLLESLCTGDKSLGKDMAVLFSEIKQFESLLVRFQGIKGSYTEEMRLLSDMVKGINTYTEEIADIAERTSILAINASIEAARVGEKGKGFAVIAGEVQKLSARTKSISESINTNLRNTTLTFNASYKSQSEAIEEAVGIMGESKRNLTDVSYSMEPKLTVIEASVKDAEGLSKKVTSKIERVTKSLQFQDKIRQILEHIGIILSTIEDSTREKGLNPERRINAGEIDSRVREKALNTFTVSEEWEALGVKINTSFTGIDGNGKDKELAEKEIKGDVTLF